VRCCLEEAQRPVVHREARRALMARFPFGIYFWVEQSQIVVVVPERIFRVETAVSEETFCRSIQTGDAYCSG